MTMIPDHLSAEEALRQLERSTTELARAAEAGDFARAAAVLASRDTELTALDRARQHFPFKPGQLEKLEQVLREADQAARALVERRETARALLREVEGVRRSLEKWKPPRRPIARLDLEL
ncbi:MAG TPA: hypothetical protein VEU62_10635 [Bryobacterales bacterium]|nr:hypothetical protein [Bryobacterales bacterium]